MLTSAGASAALHRAPPETSHRCPTDSLEIPQRFKTLFEASRWGHRYIYILYIHNYDLRFGECGPWAYLRLTRKSFAKFPGPFPQFAYLPGGGRSWNWMQVSKFHRSLDACRPARNRTRQVTLGWLGVGFVAGCWSFRASNFTRKVWSRHDLFDSM